MKLFLLFAGLLFNILLCCYPFPERKQEKNVIPATTEKVSVMSDKAVNRKPLAYSELLKSKATRLQKH